MPFFLFATHHSPFAGKSRRLLLRRLVTQRAAQDLADRSLRQFGAEFDKLRPLVVGELLGDETLQLILGERRVALYDEGLHSLARSFIGHADHGTFENTRMHRDHVLDFIWIDVEA